MTLPRWGTSDGVSKPAGRTSEPSRAPSAKRCSALYEHVCHSLTFGPWSQPRPPIISCNVGQSAAETFPAPSELRHILHNLGFRRGSVVGFNRGSGSTSLLLAAVAPAVTAGLLAGVNVEAEDGTGSCQPSGPVSGAPRLGPRRTTS